MQMVPISAENSVARIVSGKVQGTAFPFSAQYLLTCWHCVTNFDPILVRFPQIRAETEPLAAAVVWFDTSLDVAVLKISENRKLPTNVMPLEMEDDLQDGALWTAFGFPKDDSSGDRITGIIKRPQHIVDGNVEHIAMHCDQGNGFLSGFSGSPIWIGGK